MTGRRAGYVLWLLLAGCLYFFENNTGTRAVLCCSLLLPLLPAVRRMLFTADDPRGEGEKPAVILRTAPEPEEEDGSEVRPYRAGDPVNRIHWKLSAKRREWLVRTPDRGTSPEEVRTERPAGAEGKKKPGLCRKATLLCLAALTAVALCILLIPPVRLGAEALCNRLFEASERVNAYAYERFTVPEEQTVVPAALLLSLGLALLLGIVFLTGSRLLGFAAVAGCAVFQVYFGLAFPGWANVLLAAGLALWVIRRPPEVRQVRTILSAVLITAILTALLFPGVDAATEDASDPMDVRPWQRGDSIKKVHWKLSARKRELMVRRFEEPTLPEALVLLDCTVPETGTLEGDAREAIRDSLLETAASVMNAQMQNKNEVRLPLQGDHPEELTLGMGMPLVLERLARVELNAAVPFAQSLLEASQRIRRYGAAVVITTRLDGQTTDLMVNLRRMGPTLRLYLVTPTPDRPDWQRLIGRLQEAGAEVIAVAPPG